MGEREGERAARSPNRQAIARPSLLEHHTGPMDVSLGTCHEISEGGCIACFDLCMYPRAACVVARRPSMRFVCLGTAQYDTM